MDELPEVLWVYRTTALQPTSIFPFALTYGMEAIVPTKIDMPTLRTDLPEQSNAENVIKYLDTTDELRKAVAVRIGSYHSRLANLYNRCVKPHMFQSGDLVLRKVFENTADLSVGKFHPNWEGPYIVIWLGEDKLDEMPVPRMWNVMHLKRYYQ